jgi:hypothetical protein
MFNSYSYYRPSESAKVTEPLKSATDNSCGLLSLDSTSRAISINFD